MGTIIRWLMVVGWMSAVFALSSVLSLQSPFTHSADFIFRTLAHVGEYAVLTALLGWGLQRSIGRTVRAWLFAALAAALYGVSDAWHQAWIVGHFAPVRDVGIDALGIATTYVLVQRQPSQGVTAAWPCPKCHAVRVYRSRRRGRLEWCARFIALAPFRCDVCSHRFWHFAMRDG